MAGERGYAKRYASLHCGEGINQGGIYVLESQGYPIKGGGKAIQQQRESFVVSLRSSRT